MSTIFDRLGSKPVINARGIYTDLGGATLSPRVMAAVEEANRHFVSMVDLLDGSGRIIADLVDAEAARVTPGASAAIALGIAACMTGTDGEKMERLPDTTGMRDEVLIQKRHRYRYDRMVRFTGAKLIVVGDDRGTTPEQLEAAIGAQTVAMCIPAHLDDVEGAVSMREVFPVARSRGIPTLVDAAYANYPVETLSSFTRAGADLVCFSAKYFGGPNAGGFICGRRDLIDAVMSGVDVTGFEPGDRLIFGRPFKLDRQSVVGVVVALQEWIEMDHEERFARYARLVQALSDALRGLNAIELTPITLTMEEALAPEPVNALQIRVGREASRTAVEVQTLLSEGNPRVLVHCFDDALVVDVETVFEDDIPLIAQRIKAALH